MNTIQAIVKLGYKVQANFNDAHVRKGDTGTIVAYIEKDNWINVRWDNIENTHSWIIPETAHLISIVPKSYHSRRLCG